MDEYSTGSNGVYDPSRSVPSGGGGVTNRATSSSSYGMAPQVGVFVGYDKPPKGFSPSKQRKLLGDSYRGAPQPQQKTPIMLTPTQLISAFDQFSRKDYLRFRNLLVAAGLVSEDADAPTVRSAYQSLIEETVDMQAQGVKISPMGMVKNLIRMNGLDPAKIGDSEDYGKAAEAAAPQRQKSVSSSVYDLTPEDARMTLEQAVQQKLGRAPTEEEMEDFISAAQTKARNNPTTVTQEFIPGQALKGGNVETQYVDGELVGSTRTTTEAGFDANQMGQMALDRAEDAPDYGSYQAVSRLFPALVNALSATA